MKHYEISINTIHDYICVFYVSFDRKPLIHEAYAWLEKKLGVRVFNMKANTTTVREIEFEPFEV